MLKLGGNVDGPTITVILTLKANIARYAAENGNNAAAASQSSLKISSVLSGT